jgi:hypothetical protein
MSMLLRAVSVSGRRNFLARDNAAKTASRPLSGPPRATHSSFTREGQSNVDCCVCYYQARQRMVEYYGYPRPADEMGQVVLHGSLGPD